MDTSLRNDAEDFGAALDLFSVACWDLCYTARCYTSGEMPPRPAHGVRLPPMRSLNFRSSKRNWAATHNVTYRTYSGRSGCPKTCLTAVATTNLLICCETDAHRRRSCLIHTQDFCYQTCCLKLTSDNSGTYCKPDQSASGTETSGRPQIDLCCLAFGF
jgi:hypothetical protein